MTITTAELVELTAVRDKLARDLDWAGPSQRPARYVVLDRDQAALLRRLVNQVLTEETVAEWAVTRARWHSDSA